MHLIRTGLAIALLAAFGAAAHAQEDASKTRAEARRELAEAVRTGDIAVPGDSGVTWRELYPDRYPDRPALHGKTRAEVKAELAQALGSGELLASGDGDVTLRELYPDRYPEPPALAGRTRAEVRQELAQALRDGALIPGGEIGVEVLERRAPQRRSAAAATAKVIAADKDRRRAP